MLNCAEWLRQDLMDVVRLFEGAEGIDIDLTTEKIGFSLRTRVKSGVREDVFDDFPSTEENRVLGCDGAEKRYAKLALYRHLSEVFPSALPWGALTGIRPVSLARKEIGISGSFEPLFRKMDVSEDNIALVKKVLEVQGELSGERGEDLFISLPFCPTKCEYCSFITAPIAATKKYMPAYLDALERELAAIKPLISNLRSVYIGGGTPFVLEPDELKRVLNAVAPLRENGCEYTVEAGRPDTFTEEKLNTCREFGVTRICINAQSFSDTTLRAIGRRHTAEDVFHAFELSKPYGFDINCDLIAGLAEETTEEFRHSVDCAVSLSPANITVHTLCLKKGARLKETMLGEGTSRLKTEGIGEMIGYSRKALKKAGYEPYYLYRQKYMAGAHENVGWSKRGKACLYNVHVMEETESNLAVGANAITKRVFEQGTRIERCAAPKDIPTYIEKVEKIIEQKSRLFKDRE